jgi:hypothetical protein
VYAIPRQKAALERRGKNGCNNDVKELKGLHRQDNGTLPTGQAFTSIKARTKGNPSLSDKDKGRT